MISETLLLDVLGVSGVLPPELSSSIWKDVDHRAHDEFCKTYVILSIYNNATKSSYGWR